MAPLRPTTIRHVRVLNQHAATGPHHHLPWSHQPTTQEAVKLLRAHGSQATAAAMDDMNALHFAAQKGHVEVVRLLLNAGAVAVAAAAASVVVVVVIMACCTSMCTACCCSPTIPRLVSVYIHLCTPCGALLQVSLSTARTEKEQTHLCWLQQLAMRTRQRCFSSVAPTRLPGMLVGSVPLR